MEEQNNNRTKWLHLRLKPDEYQKIFKKFSKSTCRKLSEYARKNLLEKPVTTNYRNQSLDEFMSEIIRLRGELNAIGNNFNQAVKKLHTLQQIPEFKNWIISYELEKKILFNKVEEIKNYIQKMAEKWLQS
ncbi:plasmid mobilization relaxosome protein MobC [Flavobacterium sp. ZT3R18]|uniref:plasmid mobilization protein n=1 Tax=Flavobacterium sp. ZT3R18 TaxID=2594429 RepID=UPI001179D8D9|nr:plasmid mobilization relaxosome protein MobC [Flavobacterium sp. ZT3R18]TRX31669.1 plasmid mobilization relaxosome protein MobC [Flavobacterium sp. ZT3R18]